MKVRIQIIYSSHREAYRAAKLRKKIKRLFCDSLRVVLNCVTGLSFIALLLLMAIDIKPGYPYMWQLVGIFLALLIGGVSFALKHEFEERGLM